MSMKDHTVFNCLRNLREETKITQDKLAKAVGTSRQTICAMEKGEYIPSLRLALLISEHFGHPVEDVFQLKRKC
ncbi:MAG: helix-turn-helix transcriptional regulator [bacterium]|nr:helix-turn-helix transcriptional regulator [bacterium]